MQKFPESLKFPANTPETGKQLPQVQKIQSSKQDEINTQKLFDFLSKSNEKLEFKIKNTIWFTLAPQNEIPRYKSSKRHARLI